MAKKRGRDHSPTSEKQKLAKTHDAESKNTASKTVPEGDAGSMSGRPLRVYCDGIYDLFHFGHARAIEQAKKAFPNVHLLVGVCNDEITQAKKGKTVMTHEERAESLRHCKWVDEVIPNAPWIVTAEFLDLHEIDYVAHDDLPYVSDGHEDVYKFVKDMGKFLATQRTEGVSTSDLITRIVKDYEKYVRRNLDRGITAKELNISYLKEKEFHLKKQFSLFRKNFQAKLVEGEGVMKKNWLDFVNEMENWWEDTTGRQKEIDFENLTENGDYADSEFEVSESTNASQAGVGDEQGRDRLIRDFVKDTFNRFFRKRKEEFDERPTTK